MDLWQLPSDLDFALAKKIFKNLASLWKIRLSSERLNKEKQTVQKAKNMRMLTEV